MCSFRYTVSECVVEPSAPRPQGDDRATTAAATTPSTHARDSAAAAVALHKQGPVLHDVTGMLMDAVERIEVQAGLAAEVTVAPPSADGGSAAGTLPAVVRGKVRGDEGECDLAQEAVQTSRQEGAAAAELEAGLAVSGVSRTIECLLVFGGMDTQGHIHGDCLLLRPPP